MLINQLIYTIPLEAPHMDFKVSLTLAKPRHLKAEHCQPHPYFIEKIIQCLIAAAGDHRSFPLLVTHGLPDPL